MKIKRFEAASMSEALRMIKKEFGEEAVILSAKNVRKPGRLFGVGTGGQVVVTAAVDPTAVAHPSGNDAGRISLSLPTGAQETHLPGTNPKPADGIGRILQHFTPITRTGRKKMQPKFVQLMTETCKPPVSPLSAREDKSIFEKLTDQGLEGTVAVELADKVTELALSQSLADEETTSVLSQIIEAKGWVAHSQRRQSDTPRTVVLVGPCGVGKTTTVAKMAAQAIMQFRQKTGIVSLDDHRIAGTTELERYAGIMGVPFEPAGDEYQLQHAFQRFSSLELVIVDTPGLSPDDLHHREELARLLKILSAPEVHLLASAGAREQVLAKTIRFFSPLGITHLLPTHMDWAGQLGAIINQVALNRLPVGYLGTGSQVPEGIQSLSACDLAAMLLSQHTETPHDSNAPITIIQRHTAAKNSDPYVANRNSDIFHHNTCNSVSRINDDHILIFKDPEEAIDQGFKPCRMCCMSLFVPKPIDRPARRRAAGTRN